MVNKKGLSVNRPSYWPHPRMNIRGFCFGNKIGRLEEWGLNKFLVSWQGPFEKKKKIGRCYDYCHVFQGI